MELSESEKKQKRSEIIEALQRPGFPEVIQENDIDNLFIVIKPVIEYSFNSKLRFIVSKSDATTNIDLMRRSVNEELEIFIKNKMKTYLFSKKKWKHNVPIIPYLQKCISFFYIPEENALYNVQRIKSFACPACKSFMIKSELKEESNGKLYCSSCEELINSYEELQKINDDGYLKAKVEVCRTMLPHSKKGVRCLRCERFVPISLMKDGELICPFKGCGQKCDITQKMSHPVGFFYHKMVDMNNVDQFMVNLTAKTQEARLSDQQQVDEKIIKLKKIIREQQLVQGKIKATPNKHIMYDAIYDMMEKHPKNTFNYIVRKISNNDLPLQAMIFQEFAKRMLELFPIMVLSKGKEVAITDPTDSRVNLFMGYTKFTGTVDEALVLRKPTILSRFKSTCKYSCSTCQNPYICSFIGYITKIIDENGNDLMDCIDNYGFTNIKFKRGESEPGEVVTVNYYSIPSHYSVKSMAHMQRIIKRLQQRCANRNL